MLLFFTTIFCHAVICYFFAAVARSFVSPVGYSLTLLLQFFYFRSNLLLI